MMYAYFICGGRRVVVLDRFNCIKAARSWFIAPELSGLQWQTQFVLTGQKLKRKTNIYRHYSKILIKYNPQLLDKYAHHFHRNVTSTRGNPNGLILNTYIFNDHCSLHVCSVGALVSGRQIRRTMNQESNTGVCLTDQLQKS